MIGTKLFQRDQDITPFVGFAVTLSTGRCVRVRAADIGVLAQLSASTRHRAYICVCVCATVCV